MSDNVLQFKPKGVEPSEEFNGLVLWLIQQSLPGLDEMFGADPAKQYVRLTIGAHGSCGTPLAKQTHCGQLYFDTSGNQQGCHELFLLALCYLNQARKPSGFDPKWLPEHYRDQISS